MRKVLKEALVKVLVEKLSAGIGVIGVDVILLFNDLEVHSKVSQKGGYAQICNLAVAVVAFSQLHQGR